MATRAKARRSTSRRRTVAIAQRSSKTHRATPGRTAEKMKLKTIPFADLKPKSTGINSYAKALRFLSSLNDFERLRIVHEAMRGLKESGQAVGAEVLTRLTDFATSNGPALHVYLVAADDAKDNDTVKKASFLDLGPLKGNIGDQNYDVPADLDLTRYRAVSIWCRRFSVNFGAAPLAETGS
mgnify:CR=1 FL=1